MQRRLKRQHTGPERRAQRLVIAIRLSAHRTVLQVPLNLEMAATDEMLAFALEIKPADSWQSDVEDKAACNIGTAAVYKLRCRPEQFYVQTYGFYEAFDGATDRGIVINHENDGSWLTHLSSPAE